MIGSHFEKKTFPSKPKKEMLEVIIIPICLALKVKIIACPWWCFVCKESTATPKKMQKLRTLPKKTKKWNLKDEVPLFANPSFSETYSMLDFEGQSSKPWIWSKKSNLPRTQADINSWTRLTLIPSLHTFLPHYKNQTFPSIKNFKHTRITWWPFTSS